MNVVAKLEIPNLHCTLGEGPHWDVETQCLNFIDIEKRMIYAYTPKTGELKSKELPTRPGCIIPTTDNRLLVCTEKGVEVTTIEAGENVLLLDRNVMEKDLPLNRFNDGKVDPNGRLWVGSMAIDCKGTPGSLFCYSSPEKWTLERQNVGISNGLAWTADRKTMYYIDSTPKKLFAFDFDEATGAISNERVVLEVTEADCAPDGMTIDAEDNLWVAVWGGQRIMRINPKTGEETMRVKIAAKNVTSCCFGGPNLTTLYITTSTLDTDVQAFPLAGGVFSVELDQIKGTPMNRFKV
jgi:sugar lactone lactonase YvrE